MLPFPDPAHRTGRAAFPHIRLSDYFHVAAHAGTPTCSTLRRWTPKVPKIASAEYCQIHEAAACPGVGEGHSTEEAG